MKTKTLHIVLGMPAAGKSHFAARLARDRSATLVDIDTATEPVVQAAMRALSGDPNDRDSPLFKATFREPIYAALFAIADANLPHSNAVVAGPFTKELANANWLEAVAAKRPTPCSVKAYFLHCRPEVRRVRMQQRGNPRDLAKLADWGDHQRYYADQAFPAFPHVAIDTSTDGALERFFGSSQAR